jgi:hypothetical protein
LEIAYSYEQGTMHRKAPEFADWLPFLISYSGLKD